ncbi:hypothetical protein [Devosia beringensis]|uniref:hypothetical protein n=1 Tax=Devosia beringensis TaxID=2657486 RepID=UPI00186BADC2|nr:hypothetical protein [Devosia beringensis]
MSVSEKFRDFKAGKATLFWTGAACAVATMVIGFSWGGWVTGGSAQERADLTAEQAVAELAADICVKRYLASPDARVSLTALIEESTYSRDGTLEEAGWVTFGDREEPVDGAAGLCADRLAEVDITSLPETSVAATAPAATPISSVQ